MLDDQGREWSGSFERQQMLTTKIIELIEREHPVDIAGALATIVCNLICDHSNNVSDAFEALQAFHGDMQTTVTERFNHVRTRQ